MLLLKFIGKAQVLIRNFMPEHNSLLEFNSNVELAVVTLYFNVKQRVLKILGIWIFCQTDLTSYIINLI